MSIAWEEGVRDPKRVLALRQSGLVGTGPEDPFDRFIELAETFTHKSAVWIGDGEPHSGDIAESFCRYVVGTGQPLIVDDAVNDARTSDNPAIELHKVAAWAGYPIEDVNGAVLGTFCLIDSSPHPWSDQDILILATLSQAVSTEIALRRSVTELVESRKVIEELREVKN
jgi:sigma-B regulation protein RsbU (phosphoserine phosphatase)